MNEHFTGSHRLIAAVLAAGLLSACHRAKTAPPIPPPASAAVLGATTAGSLHVTGGSSRATPIAGVTGAGYLVIENTGSTADVLLGASADVAADGVQLHQMKMTPDGQMRMRALPEGLPVPAGSRVELGEGGTHLMLLGVKRALVAGETVPIVLHFAKAGDVPLVLNVEALEPAP